MTTTELDPQAAGGCSPDGTCAVVDDHAPLGRRPRDDSRRRISNSRGF